MENYKSFKDDGGKKHKQWGGGHFAKWLNYKKFEDKNADLKLPQIANEAEQLAKTVGGGAASVTWDTENKSWVFAEGFGVGTVFAADPAPDDVLIAKGITSTPKSKKIYLVKK